MFHKWILIIEEGWFYENVEFKRQHNFSIVGVGFPSLKGIIIFINCLYATIFLTENISQLRFSN